MRRGELLALRWGDVDFEQSSIRVFEGYSANTTGKTKSRKSRTVPMVKKVAERLETLKRRPFPDRCQLDERVRSLLFAIVEQAIEPVASEPRLDWPSGPLAWYEAARFYVR